MSEAAAPVSTAKVTVSPEEFTFVKYDSAEIAAIVAELAEQLEIANPIQVIVDETTPLAKVYEEIDAASSDAMITLHAESGALEDRQHPMSFSADNARESLGRILLRAHDRMRPDFADAPGDLDLTLEQNAAWDTYCAGRLARMGVARQPAALALQPPQPVRFPRRRRRALRSTLVGRRPQLVRRHGRLTPSNPVCTAVRGGVPMRWVRHGGAVDARSACASRGRAPCPAAASGRRDCRPTTRTG